MHWSDDEIALRHQAEQGFTVVCNASVKGPHTNLIAWAKDNDKYTYIGRRIPFHKEYTTDSRWCNKPPKEIKGDKIAEVNYFITEIYNKRPDLQAAIHELRGRVLGCWCKPGPCHGDFLAREAKIPG